MSEGDHVNEATEHNTEENSAELVSKESEGEGGAPEGNVHGDEGSDEVKINEQKRTFGEEGEEEDAEEYDDEEEYDDDEGKNPLFSFLVTGICRRFNRLWKGAPSLSLLTPLLFFLLA
jgi:hypothetical protein